MISQRAIDLCVECEVSSRAYYEKHYTHPEWPGGASGVTQAIGYDLGWTDSAKLNRDWRQLTQPVMFVAMQDCLGVHGAAARDLLPKVKNTITVSWDVATKVFLNSDVPEYTNGVIAKIPKAAELPSDCLGALFSIAYNRGNGGWTADGDRFLEMRQIRDAIQAGEPEKVPALIRAMKRHWPNPDPHSVDHGLRLRRDAEAQLFEDGLKNRAPAPPTNLAVSPSPARTLPPAPADATTHASAAAATLPVASAVSEAKTAGWSGAEIAALLIGGAIAVGVLWAAIRQLRQQPTIARAKDSPDGAAA